jgi:hypothetical protein
MPARRREQEYSAGGITEDLTTDFSRIADMLVISRNTAFTYQGKRADTKEIGRELGVRHLKGASEDREIAFGSTHNRGSRRGPGCRLLSGKSHRQRR